MQPHRTSTCCLDLLKTPNHGPVSWKRPATPAASPLQMTMPPPALWARIYADDMPWASCARQIDKMQDSSTFNGLLALPSRIDRHTRHGSSAPRSACVSLLCRASLRPPGPSICLRSMRYSVPRACFGSGSAALFPWPPCLALAEPAPCLPSMSNVDHAPRLREAARRGWPPIVFRKTPARSRRHAPCRNWRLFPRGPRQGYGSHKIIIAMGPQRRSAGRSVRSMSRGPNRGTRHGSYAAVDQREPIAATPCCQRLMTLG